MIGALWALAWANAGTAGVVLDGEVEAWTSRGRRRVVATYQQGELDGERRTYDRRGHLLQVERFEEGELVSSRRETPLRGIAVRKKAWFAGVSIRPHDGGFWTSPEGDVDGLSVVLLQSRIADVDGVEISLYRSSSWSVTGLQVAPLTTGTRHVGVRANLIGNAERTTGIGLAPFDAITYQLHGLQVGGLASAGSLRGVQIGAVALARAGPARGWQLGVLTYSYGGLSGVASGVVNVTEEDVEGLQVGVWNHAEYQRGVQLGLINVAGYNSGLQIGLINVQLSESQRARVTPLVGIGKRRGGRLGREPADAA